MYTPLYRRIRPLTIDEVVGQEHLLGKGALLRSVVESGKIPSMLFYGPPGVGKTLVAEIIADNVKASFVKLSAVTSGIKEIRNIANEAKIRKKRGENVILFIDEIHRFNKAQQDFLLPFLEDGTFIVIGASTENPLFALNKALLSRMLVFEFKELSKEDIKKILRRAIKVLGIEEKLQEEILDAIAEKTGDARKALMVLEVLLESLNSEPPEETIKDIINMTLKGHSYDDEERYNVISAFIKSIRGSDPDAAIYWLTVMLKSGEDPLYITRRLMILAAEDIGLANPQALIVATSAHTAVAHVGLPEGAIILAMATLYLAASPKSNSAYKALKLAEETIDREGITKVPEHIKDSHSWEKIKGKAQPYLYPHDFPEGFIKQDYTCKKYRFYFPKNVGKEKKIAEYLRGLWGERYNT